MPLNIHDRARALANTKGITTTAAYVELASRAVNARRARRRRVLGAMTATAGDNGIDSSGQRQWLPYADN